MHKPQPTPLLSREEERTLARAIEAGVLAEHLLATGERPLPATTQELATIAEIGAQAWHRFLLANLRLVWQLAGRMAGRSGLPKEELFQEGFVALAGALQRFDPDRGRFSTFATVRVRQHLAEVAAGRFGQLCLPPGRALRLTRARGLEASLGQELGHSVAATELAAGLGRSVDWTRRLVGYRPPLPVDPADESLAIPDPSPVDPDAAIYAAQFRRLLRRLDAEQALVLSLHYGLTTGDPVELAEIASRLGLSLSTVRRLEKRALAALRQVAQALDPSAPEPLAG